MCYTLIMSKFTEIKQLVFTVRDRCRVCFTCVRECPAKAIKFINGQAEVINERCIGCGNCTKVCSQGAKVFLRSIEPVKHFLQTEKMVIAAVAPSFPAEFNNVDYQRFVGMTKALGFTKVVEVAFGADVVAQLYKDLFSQECIEPYISANCPAIVHYIRQYHPHLVHQLAPIASPIVALTRILRNIYGTDSKIVFIGPCVAKKSESDEIDEVLTFRELREMFTNFDIKPENVTPQEFDPPLSGKGTIFPVSRGMLQTADIEDNVFEGNVVVAEGRANFQDAIKEFQAGLLSSQHLDLLCCDGCIMGPGMSANGKQYARRYEVTRYVRTRIKSFDQEQWQKDINEALTLDLSQSYSENDRRFDLPSEEEISKILHSMNKMTTTDHLDCGACGYESCREHAIAVARGYAEIEMCLPYSIQKLHNSIDELAISHDKVASMSQALKQSEKLASMGQLSAGIAHEINNPLGVVIMYANILLDECSKDSQIAQDLKLIVEQADRCKRIVGGLLNFARKNQVNFAENDIVKLTEKSLNSVIVPSNVTITLNKLARNNIAMFDEEQMIQVVTNLVKNGFEAMPNGGVLTITLDSDANDVIIKISDTGTGIKPEDLAQIFEPFFTTKGIGKGTGLGLATTYGIVKMHKGQIEVTSNAAPAKGQTGTSFTIKIPRNR